MSSMDPEVKEVKGRISVLKAMPYRGIMVYIRRIGRDIFEYLVPHKGEVYSSYLIIKPRRWHLWLGREDVNRAAGIIFAGATTTIDILLDVEESKDAEGV